MHLGFLSNYQHVFGFICCSRLLLVQLSTQPSFFFQPIFLYFQGNQLSSNFYGHNICFVLNIFIQLKHRHLNRITNWRIPPPLHRGPKSSSRNQHPRFWPFHWSSCTTSLPPQNYQWTKWVWISSCLLDPLCEELSNLLNQHHQLACLNELPFSRTIPSQLSFFDRTSRKVCYLLIMLQILKGLEFQEEN